MSNGQVELPYVEDLGLFLTSVDKDSEDTWGLILSSAWWPFSHLLCVCVCMCTRLYVGGYLSICVGIHMRAWRSQINAGNHSFVLYSVRKDLSVWLISLDNLLWGPLCFSLPKLGLQAGCHAYLIVMWVLGSELWFSCLCHEHFNHWAISSAKFMIFKGSILHHVTCRNLGLWHLCRPFVEENFYVGFCKEEFLLFFLFCLQDSNICGKY